MFKLLLPLLAVVVLGQACNYEKLDKIEKLMGKKDTLQHSIDIRYNKLLKIIPVLIDQ